MVLFAGADPLKWGQEFVVIAVVCVALALCYRYKSRVIFLLTGDDKIHATCLDCLYLWFCKCGGLCNGEWTRCLTSCSCCPSWLYQRNLVKEFARCLGMSTKVVEIKNIVCGDLPYDGSRGDFYVCVSVGTNPDMVTALQEEKMPKLVHFPEILQLKICDSPLEPRVKITVKELNIAGSEVLCELHLNPTSIVDWCNDESPLKRFQMKAVNSDIERETPPWICMEFGTEVSENRMIDSLPNIFSMLRVRTFLPPTGPQDQTAMNPNAYHPGLNPNANAHPVERKRTSIMTSDGTELGTRQVEDLNTTDFKYKYTLVDDSGNPVEEPKEEDLNKIQRMRRCVLWAFKCFDCIIMLVICSYIVFRLYVWSCYRQFVWMTMAELHHAKFPISNVDLKALVGQCHREVDGTGIAVGAPCRPNYQQTLQVCEGLMEANRPEAFVGMIYNVFGWKVKGITCFHGVCAFRNSLVEYDWVCIWGVLALLICTRCARCGADQCVKRYKRGLQASHSKDIKEFHDLRSMKSGGGSSAGYQQQGYSGVSGGSGGGTNMGRAAAPGGFV